VSTSCGIVGVVHSSVVSPVKFLINGDVNDRSDLGGLSAVLVVQKLHFIDNPQQLTREGQCTLRCLA